MKQTLLEMVQDILSEMDSDDVGSIRDTPEAMQVANILKNVFYAQIATRNWPHLKKLIHLEHSGNPDKPTHLKTPENIKELEFFKYDGSKEPNLKNAYNEVKYKYPDEFLRLVSHRAPNTSTVEEVEDFSGTKLFIINNKAPTFWTSFDDNYIVCDSYDREVDDALKSIKTQAFVVTTPKWIMMDDAVPDLPAEAFPGLLEEAKSRAFYVLKQMANEKAEQESVRQQRWLSRKSWKNHGGIRTPNYGRRSAK